VFPRVEVRHLHAVVVLAEELNFTRAADRLNITQSGFSKQINEVEALHRFHLFIRTNKKNVELTEVGRIFVEEARLALWHIDRAVHAAREGSNSILTIGHSPDADLAWISAILAIRLPMYPKLRVQLISEFSGELVRRVMAGDLNMALVTAPPESCRITAAAFARTHLYAALPQVHALLRRKKLLSKIWRKTNGFCLPGDLIPWFVTQSWTRHNVRASLRSTRTISLPPKKQFTWYLSTLEWQS